MSTKRRIIVGAAAAFLFQALSLGVMVAMHGYALRWGETLILRVTPADPRHLLLGHYLRLEFSISTADPKIAAEAGLATEQVVYAALRKAEDGVWEVAGLHPAMQPFSPERPVLRARLVRVGVNDRGRRDRLYYGIERYYLDERAAKAMDERLTAGGIQVEVAVSRSTGQAAIRRILVNGEPVHRDPLLF